MSETVNPPPAPDGDNVFVLTAKGGRERRKPGDIRGHDFRQSGFLAASELRRIRQRHEQFIRSLAARLAIFLRLEFSLQLAKVHIVSYEKFTATLPSPTHITLFKTDPLKGVGLLVLTPRLGLTLVDRLLGGPGQPAEEKRDLTEIEIALIDQVATLILTEWCNHWPEMRDLRPALLGQDPVHRVARAGNDGQVALAQEGLGRQVELTPAGAGDFRGACGRQDREAKGL